jgi:uncharacterized membrane protein YqaE (UPF0057 family)
MSDTVTSSSTSTGDIFMIVLAILLPPVAVAIRKGIGTKLLLNIVLTILGYVPGLIHAVWLIAKS